MIYEQYWMTYEVINKVTALNNKAQMSGYIIPLFI